MKDIPVFTTEHGAASLTLSEIPYTQRAYIRIQASSDPEAFLAECLDFCRAAGAENIYAAGIPDSYPVHTEVWQMQGPMPELSDACLFPVTEQTLEIFRSMYNDKAVKVPNAAWMTMGKSQELLKQGSAYFVREDGSLIGFGIASGDTVNWVASVVPGGGKAVMQALCSVLTGDSIKIEVASANTKAVRLYEEMGFTVSKVLSKWFTVTDKK